MLIYVLVVGYTMGEYDGDDHVVVYAGTNIGEMVAEAQKQVTFGPTDIVCEIWENGSRTRETDIGAILKQDI